jgi:tRNA-dihydrouridine synthase B
MKSFGESPVPRIILAPLLGVTTAAFRKVFATHFSGIQEALAPFILSTKNLSDYPKTVRDLLPENNAAGMRVVPQIVSNQGKEFAALANYLRESLGYDEVNWNLGCAAGTTPSRLRGAGLLEHPSLIESFLTEAFASFKGTISIKLRLGLRTPEESMRLVPIFNRFPIQEICMHPRVGRQYAGAVHLDAFAAFAENINHPLVYNGDIRTSGDAEIVVKRFPRLAGLMIGRGVIANPWLPQTIHKPSEHSGPIDLLGLKRFHDDLFRVYAETMDGGPQPVLGRMRELWPYWTTLFPDRERQIRVILRSKSFEAYLIATEEIFAEKTTCRA